MYAKINIRTISGEVQRITRKYGETEPLKLAEAMDIIVSFEPMGLYEGCCKVFLSTIAGRNTSLSTAICQRNCSVSCLPMS